MGYSLDFTPTKQKFCMQYRDIARREHTLEHEFGYIFKALLKQGETFSSLSRKTGVDRDTFSRWAKQLGLKSLGSSAPYVREAQSRSEYAIKYSFDYEETLKLYNDGLTLAEIAGKLRIPTGVVEYRMRKTMISKGELRAKCDYCEVQFEKYRMNQHFCSSKCVYRYRNYLLKVVRRGLGVGRIGDISECRSSQCVETWKIIDKASSQRLYCSTKCQKRTYYLNHRNAAKHNNQAVI